MKWPVSVCVCVCVYIYIYIKKYYFDISSHDNTTFYSMFDQINAINVLMSIRHFLIKNEIIYMCVYIYINIHKPFLNI